MGGLLAFFGAGPARLQALLIAAMAMLALVLALTTWALVERTKRLSLKVEVVALRAQSDVLADSLGRCNAGVEAAAKAGIAAQGDVKRLVAAAEKAATRTEAARRDIRTILSKPAPTRPDGKPKDCIDAIAEIKAKVRP